MRATARPSDADWHDFVAATLQKLAAGEWRHAIVLSERERRGAAASSHRIHPIRQALRRLALTELRHELWGATSTIDDAEADAAAALALERWATADSPEECDLGLEPGLWSRHYAVNAPAAVASLACLADGAGDSGAILLPEDRLAAIRACSLAWQEGSAHPTGMDALLPLLLWALARAHVPPAAPLRLASHCAFIMRFLDAESYSAGGEEMWCATLLEIALRAALASAGWAPTRWRYHNSSPGSIQT